MDEFCKIPNLQDEQQQFNLRIMGERFQLPINFEYTNYSGIIFV
jgi:hypothetical protein